MDNLIPFFEKFSGKGLIPLFLSGFVVAGAILVFALLYEGIATYVERKIAGDIQSRIGPNRVGPYGFFQWIADGVKLLLKEDFIPPFADKLIFRIAPYIVFSGSYLAFSVLPFWERFVPVNINVGLLFIMGVTAMVAPGIVFAGWASNNKWSILGGMRAVAQLVSYEVPAMIILLIPVTIASTVDLNEMVRYQGGGLGIFRWIIFHNPFSFMAFFIYLVSAIAECNRTPFDLPEAESELVAGYAVEYSSFRYAMFFMGEYGDMFVVSAVGACAFLGGWQVPFLGEILKPGILSDILQLGSFLAKTLFLIIFMMWVRWTFPRLRVDQLMELSWKRLLPISFFLLLASTGWVLYFDGKSLWEIVFGG